MPHREIVNTNDLGTISGKPPRDVRPDEPGDTGDENGTHGHTVILRRD